MDYSLPEEHFQQNIEIIINDVLKEEAIALFITDVIVKEEQELSLIECMLCRDGECAPLSANGSGIADALFTALVRHCSAEFLCLRKVAFEDFNLKANFKDSVKVHRSDATVEVTLVLKSSNARRLYFRASSRSLISAVIESVRKSIQFLINCEKTVTELYLHIEELRENGRRQAEEVRVLKLADVVRVADFEETIKRVKWQTKKNPAP